jgi:hypothetical protein
MAGIKGRGGAKGRSGKSPGSRTTNGGRRVTSVKALQPLYDAIRSAASRFAPGDATECDTDISLRYCPLCGQWGWEGGSIAVWGKDFGAVEGSTPLASEPVGLQKLRHTNRCPAK